MEKKKILIADNDYTHCVNLTDILSKKGYVVYSAGTCKDSISMVLKYKPHIVMMDLKFPDGSSIDLISKIIAINNEALCIITTFTKIDPEISLAHKGVFHYFQKPLQIETLIQFLKKTFIRNSFFKEQENTQKKLKAKNLELEIINTKLKKIVSSFKEIAFCTSIKKMGKLLLNSFAENIDAQGASFFIKEKKGLILSYSLDSNHVPLIIPFPLKKRSVLETIFTQKRNLLIKNIKNHHHLTTSGWGGYKNNSFLGLPLFDEPDNIVGIICLHNKLNKNSFTHQDLEIGSIIASYSCEILRSVKAREALSKSEQNYREVVNNANDAIFIVHNNKIKFSNPKTMSLTGYKTSELTNINFLSIIDPDYRKYFVEKNHIIEFKKQYEFNAVKILKKNGNTFQALIQSIPVNWNQTYASLIFIKDISKLKQLEKQVARTQKTEAIGTLASGIAHDFNNILAGIMGYTEILLRKNSDNKDIINYVDKIYQASLRARKLIAQMLSFNRNNKTKKKNVNLGIVVKDALSLLKASLPSNIFIKQCIDKNSCCIFADAIQIQQIVLNLCTNAAHAIGHKGGVLTVIVEKKYTVPITANNSDIKQNAYNKLTITDTGHGIDKNTILKIFDPYFTTKKRGEGTGLGLTIVSGIIKRHKGTITVTSKINQGTSFYIYFPHIKLDKILPEKKKSKVK